MTKITERISAIPPQPLKGMGFLAIFYMKTDIKQDLIQQQVKDFIASTQKTIGDFCNNQQIFCMVSDAVDVICACRGKIITTGMGKAGMRLKRLHLRFLHWAWLLVIFIQLRLHMVILESYRTEMLC